MTAYFLERDEDPMSNALVHEAAQGAAQRVDAEAVGLDPAMITLILTQILPLIISCFRREEPSPQEIQRAVRRKTRTPRLRARFLRNLSHSIQEKSDTELTDEQADAMAEAVLEETLNQNPQMVSAVCGAV